MLRNLFSLLLVVLVAVSCGSKSGSDNVKTEKKPQNDSCVRIAVLPTLDALPFFIANERGLFDKENLNVSLVPFNSHLDVDTALAGGSVDAAFTDLVRTERMKSHDGVELQYLTTTELNWSLVSNRTARINKLDQLGDKMVAMTRWSATDYLTDKVFSAVKTKSQVYSVQINDLDVRLKMLLNNEMDAAWYPEPQATAAVSAGHKLLQGADKNKEKLGVLAVRKQKGKKSIAGMENKLKTIYSAACDSINKNGIKAYAVEIAKYCHVSEDVVAKIPNHVFTHAEQPLEKNLLVAKQFKRNDR